MKRHGLLKILGITVLVLLILSWIIPASQVSGTSLSNAGLSRVGLFDLFNYPLQTFQYFVQMALFMLVVGGFYGVLSKISKYNDMLEQLAKKLKGKETVFLIVVAFIFAGLSSVFGLSVILFVFIPMLVSIILLLGYDKLVAFLITCVSILVGIIGSTFNLYTIGYLNQVLETEYSTLIIAKLVIFVVVFLLYIVFTLKYANKVKGSAKNSFLEEKTEDVFYLKESSEEEVEDDKKSSKSKKTSKVKASTKKKDNRIVQSSNEKLIKKIMIISLIVLAVLFGLSFVFNLFMPIIVGFIIRMVVIGLAIILLIVFNVLYARRNNYIIILEVLIFLFALVFMSCTPWQEAFQIKAFATLNDTITTAKVGDYTVWTFILGQVSELGAWYYGEITIIVIMASILLGLVYKVKIDDFIDNFGEGIKKVLLPTVVMTLAMAVLIISTFHAIFPTICDALIGWSDNFNIISIFITSFLAIIGSFLNVEMVYLSQSAVGFFGGLFTDAKPILSVIFSSMYGLTMMVAPTSLMLILGLEYLKIPYTKWLKFSWKFLLEILVILLIIFIIITLI